ncbi:MAG: 2TM domain-containing protein [Desulfatibacillum sp.]|nr:2TM domain-containing protein [Desulfatibacillum sp.]
MDTPMDLEGKFALAKKSVDAKLGFFKHLTLFFVGNGFLTGVDLVTTPGLVWFYWPVLVWTLILGVHARWVWSGQDKG